MNAIDTGIGVALVVSLGGVAYAAWKSKNPSYRWTSDTVAIVRRIRGGAGVLGVEARFAGQPRHANPFTEPKAADQWDSGWQSADRGYYYQ